MSQERIDKANSSPENVAELGAMDTRGEIMFLTLESKQSVLELARDKYHPKYWYCADVITRAVNEGKMEAAQKFFACFDKWIKNPGDPAVLDQILQNLEVDARTRAQMKTMDRSKLVTSAMAAGEYRNEELASLGLYVLLNEGGNKDVTSPSQRVFNDTIFRGSEPDRLASLLEKALNI